MGTQHADHPGARACGDDREAAASLRTVSTAATVSPSTRSFGAAEWGLLLGISLIWGGSFLFMAIGLEAFAPGLVTWLRVGLGALTLAAIPAARRPIAPDDRARLVALSFLWVAIPFTLFPLAQRSLDSGVAGMLNGATPLFAAAVGFALHRRIPGRPVLVGLLVGFAGVVAISLPQGARGALSGALLVLAATLCYGFALNIAEPLQLRYGSLVVMGRMLALAAVWTAPLGIAALGESTFRWGPFTAVAVAGVAGTGLAFVMMGSLVGRAGPTRASFTTYVIPAVAILLGALVRHEPVNAVSVVGIVLVVAGALLASRSG